LLTGTDLRSNLLEGLSDLGGMLIQQSTRMVRNLVQAGLEFGIVLLASFYFFRDGDRMVAWMQDVLPITSDRRRLVLKRFDEVVKGAVYGNTVVALAEGLIGGLAFWLVGLPSPLLWGAVMAITAYLPLIGAGLVWVPAAMYFGVQGAYGRMWVLIAAGIGIAVIDYLVRNIVVGEASKLHSLIMFFSVIGGIEFFGLVGIVAGPLIVAVAVALLETYRSEQAALFTTTAVEPREKRIPPDGGVGC
jgi:predicted PurR-regulated permease PerM